jgi:hypothetical protein
MNAIPGTYLGHLASPFLLIHGVGHDKWTWIPLFSLCYFHHKKDSDQQRSHHQAHTMDGLVIGRSPTLNALLVYNPRNKQFYKPNSYRINPYCLSTSVYPSSSTAAFSAISFAMRIPTWKRSTLQAHGLNGSTLPPILFCQVPLWTSLSLLRLPVS